MYVYNYLGGIDVAIEVRTRGRLGLDALQMSNNHAISSLK